MANALVRSEQPLDGERSDLAEQYLSFRCRDERYALPICLVREIIEYGQVTPVPMMPAFIRGVINLRGHVVPVVDLACRFGFDVGQRNKRTCIIILELEQAGEIRVMGLIVDAVDSVFDLEQDEIEAAPQFGTGIRTDFIAGMARNDSGFTIILEIDRVLSLEEMKQVAEAGQHGQSLMERDAP